MRPRHKQRKPGEMNGTETAWAENLELMKRAGEIIDYRFEAVKFKLAENTFFTPDFFVTYPDRFEIHEVKGGLIQDDAVVKFKVAAAMYPHFRWVMWQKKNKSTPWTAIREV